MSCWVRGLVNVSQDEQGEEGDHRVSSLYWRMSDTIVCTVCTVTCVCECVCVRVTVVCEQCVCVTVCTKYMCSCVGESVAL